MPLHTLTGWKKFSEKKNPYSSASTLKTFRKLSVERFRHYCKLCIHCHSMGQLDPAGAAGAPWTEAGSCCTGQRLSSWSQKELGGIHLLYEVFSMLFHLKKRCSQSKARPHREAESSSLSKEMRSWQVFIWSGAGCYAQIVREDNYLSVLRVNYQAKPNIEWYLILYF